MAITKILARKGRLDIGINYVLNGDKTEEHVLTARLNCDPGRECRQMLDTKRAVGKTDGVQYYHIIQSFKPGEITPELALEIAKEFAEAHLSGYQTVIGVHVDKAHIHAHTVTIGKKEVTATPKDVTITRGSAIPAFELIYTGLLGEDTLTPSTDPTFTCFEADGTTSVSTRTAAGTYTITWTNTDIFDDETNYRVVAAPGTLTINNPSYSGGSSTPSYSVTVPKTENGTITVSPKSASRGGTVTITVTPDDGYTLETLTATDSKGNEIELTDKGNGKYTFQMPASKVTVEATFVPVETEPQPCDGGVTCPAYHFTDVDTSAWYHEAVDYVLVNGLMSGYGGGLFGPNDTLSRAQLAQILYNRDGQPTTGSSGVFTDVAGDAWYSDAVTWANLSGIVEGYGNGRFGPNDPITREQLAVMLYRYAQLKGKGFTGMWAFRLDYADAASVSDYAYEAMCWCTMNGVISGYEDKTLRPQNNATRAQVAQMLKNFLENIGK